MASTNNCNQLVLLLLKESISEIGKPTGCRRCWFTPSYSPRTDYRRQNHTYPPPLPMHLLEKSFRSKFINFKHLTALPAGFRLFRQECPPKSRCPVEDLTECEPKRRS